MLNVSFLPQGHICQLNIMLYNGQGSLQVVLVQNVYNAYCIIFISSLSDFLKSSMFWFYWNFIKWGLDLAKNLFYYSNQIQPLIKSKTQFPHWEFMKWMHLTKEMPDNINQMCNTDISTVLKAPKSKTAQFERQQSIDVHVFNLVFYKYKNVGYSRLILIKGHNGLIPKTLSFMISSPFFFKKRTVHTR